MRVADRLGDARSGGPLQGSLDHLALLVLMDGAAEVTIGQARYRLVLEKVFRLEECSGGFVYFLRDARALRRRLRELAAAAGTAGLGAACSWAVPHRGN